MPRGIASLAMSYGWAAVLGFVLVLPGSKVAFAAGEGSTPGLRTVRRWDRSLRKPACQLAGRRSPVVKDANLVVVTLLASPSGNLAGIGVGGRAMRPARLPPRRPS